MTPPRSVVSSLVVLLALAGSFLAPTTVQAQGLKVGVVDIGLLFKEYKRKDQLEEEINKYREDVQQDVTKKRELLEKLVKDLDEQIKKGLILKFSDRYNQAYRRIQLEEFKLKQLSEAKQAQLKDKVERFTLQILEELQIAVKEYAEENGFHLVFKVDNSGALDGDDKDGALSKRRKEKFQEKIFRAQIQDIFFYSPRIDITKKVLATKLNNKGFVDRMIKRAAEQEKIRRTRNRPVTPKDEGDPK